MKKQTVIIAHETLWQSILFDAVTLFMVIAQARNRLSPSHRASFDGWLLNKIRK